MLDIEIMLKYDLSIFMHKLKRIIQAVNFKPYLTNINKIHNHLTNFQKQTTFPRVNSHYGLKSLPYFGCKLWKNCSET